MLRSVVRLILPIVGGGSSPIVGSNESSSSVTNSRADALSGQGHLIPSRQMPIVLNSNFGSEERNPMSLALKEEERRLARMKHNFDDMVVFEGGVLADHEYYGKDMIFRDFIHYALYHYRWGFFPKLWKKYRQLMSSMFFDPVPFGSLRNEHDYKIYVGKQAEATPTFSTPGSIFQPYYGWVLAEYMISVMRAKFDPGEPLVVYDVGAGSGTLALTILDFLAEQYPEVYARCEYHLIDMSPYVIPMQRAKLIHHMNHVRIHHISIHNWKELEPRRCFVLAFELFSNMPHDQIIWANDGATYEMWVRFAESDNLATAEEKTYATKDPIILRYLRYSKWMQEETFHSLKVLCVTDGRENVDPPRWRLLEPELYDSHYVAATKGFVAINPLRIVYLPTAQMLMFEVLAQYFPRHHALFGDWGEVLHGIPGINAPLVQVKMRIAKDIFFRRVCRSLLQNAGMCDVCFPTDFDMLTTVYKSVCGEHKEVACMAHPDFWRTFGGHNTAIFATQTGFNPMLEDFGEFRIFSSHHPAEL